MLSKKVCPHLLEQKYRFWACNYNIVQASIIFHCVGPLSARHKKAFCWLADGGLMLDVNCHPSPISFRNVEAVACEQQKGSSACTITQSDRCHCYSIYV